MIRSPAPAVPGARPHLEADVFAILGIAADPPAAMPLAPGQPDAARPIRRAPRALWPAAAAGCAMVALALVFAMAPHDANVAPGQPEVAQPGAAGPASPAPVAPRVPASVDDRPHAPIDAAAASADPDRRASSAVPSRHKVKPPAAVPAPLVPTVAPALPRLSAVARPALEPARQAASSARTASATPRPAAPQARLPRPDLPRSDTPATGTGTAAAPPARGATLASTEPAAHPVVDPVPASLVVGPSSAQNEAAALTRRRRESLDLMRALRRQ